VWQISHDVDTVVCAPDDGWKHHPKHIEPFPDTNKLCNVAYCWIYIGILLGAHPILHISRKKVNKLQHCWCLGNKGQQEQQMADIVWCVAVEIWRFYCELSWNVPLSWESAACEQAIRIRTGHFRWQLAESICRA
jgi:hypothetical protein